MIWRGRTTQNIDAPLERRADRHAAFHRNFMNGSDRNNIFDDGGGGGDAELSPLPPPMHSSSSSSTTTMTSNRRPVVRSIVDLDANPPRPTTTDDRQQGSRRAYYADDDSDVSSEVSSDEAEAARLAPHSPLVVPIDGGANATTTSSSRDEGRCYCVPRDNKEWCIVVLVILVILAIAAGIGLGLGLFAFVASEQNNTPGDDGTVSDVGGDGGGGNRPTYSPSALLSIEKPPPDDLGGAIEYHVVMQEISDLASFDDLDGGEEDGGDGDSSPHLSPQQMARDFMVFGDVLPVSLMDEDDEGRTKTDDDDDDPLAVDDYTVYDAGARPYLDANAPAYRIAQRYSMIVLYHAMNGSHWETNDLWLGPGVHECDFVGVTCEYFSIPSISLSEALEVSPSDMPHHETVATVNDATVSERMVVAIDLPENNVGGTLPREISGLPYLRRLGLWSNAIGGSVPTELGMLTRLSSLLLDDNLLEGNIPSEIGMLAEMTDLSLGPNLGISGRIPDEIGDLYRLERLNLSVMSLMESIPTSLGRLANLTELNLRGNRLRRGLPEEMGNLVNLESLILSDNEFTGSIPRSWSSLVNLKRLEIQSNEMSFVVDEDICSLRSDLQGGGGSLETLVVDCEGNEPKVKCSCCTSCSR